MKIYILNALLILLSLVLITSCSSTADSVTPTEKSPSSASEPAATEIHFEPTQAPEPIEIQVSHECQPCELLRPTEIAALEFAEFEVSDGVPGDRAPLALGEANTCQWDLGDPTAQFHFRLYLAVVRIGSDETSQEAYNGQSRRMIKPVPVTDICDQAECSEIANGLLCLDGDFLFHLRADIASSTVDFQEALKTLASLIVDRN